MLYKQLAFKHTHTHILPYQHNYQTAENVLSTDLKDALAQLHGAVSTRYKT